MLPADNDCITPHFWKQIKKRSSSNSDDTPSAIRALTLSSFAADICSVDHHVILPCKELDLQWENIFNFPSPSTPPLSLMHTQHNSNHVVWSIKKLARLYQGPWIIFINFVKVVQTLIIGSWDTLLSTHCVEFSFSTPETCSVVWLPSLPYLTKAHGNTTVVSFTATSLLTTSSFTRQMVITLKISDLI